MKETILNDYKKEKKTYHAFRERIINLISDLLLSQELYVHQITGRTKTLESLSKKLDDKGEKYTCLGDITDIVGIRIITYMESDVDLVSQILRKEFSVDTKNSIDKRLLKSDQFGYRSLHIVVELDDSRFTLKEYKRYTGLKCEIQIRSILQHAWAEIEHDLGYKGDKGVPDEYKRSFNRLSALLETADIEFDRLKNELNSYKEDIPELIKSKPEIVDINQVSLLSFIHSNSIFQDGIKIVERQIGTPMKEMESIQIDGYSEVLEYFEIKNISDLENMLKNNKDKYLSFVGQYVKMFKKGTHPYKGAVVLYFCHFLAGKTQDLDFCKRYTKYFLNTASDEEVEGLAKKYIDTYKKIDT